MMVEVERLTVVLVSMHWRIIESKWIQIREKHGNQIIEVKTYQESTRVIELVSPYQS